MLIMLKNKASNFSTNLFDLRCIILQKLWITCEKAGMDISPSDGGIRQGQNLKTFPYENSVNVSDLAGAKALQGIAMLMQKH
jgi:hypothetical protein